jgi:hypothetical protein
MDRDRVRELCEELRQILANLDVAVAEEEGEAVLEAAWLRSVLRARRVRQSYFEPNLFADPAWDMMLDLLASRLEGRTLSVSALCLGSGVPQTTALRRIDLLVERGMITRRPDASDRRRVLVDLSQSAAVRLEACLVAMREFA